MPIAVDDFGLSVLIFAGIFAIGAVGLNVLTGYAGQVSLGHAFFMALGAYSGSWLGAGEGSPLWVWLPAAAVVGGVAGGAIGPFALRLRGNYVAVVSLSLVLVGLHIWNNAESVTGGAAGVAGRPSAALGPLDFNRMSLAGQEYSRNQSWFWLVWALVALVVLLASNLVGSRAGRAMRAVRDREVAACVLGVHPARYKIGAFIVSSALAAVAGSLYFAFVGYVSPDEWGLRLSIQFVAMVIVGGLGTVPGPVLGALFVAGLPRLVEGLSRRLGLRATAGLSTEELNQLAFGVLVIAFAVCAPHGLAGAWARLRARLRRSPSGSWAEPGTGPGGESPEPSPSTAGIDAGGRIDPCGR